MKNKIPKIINLPSQLNMSFLFIFFSVFISDSYNTDPIFSFVLTYKKSNSPTYFLLFAYSLSYLFSNLDPNYFLIIFLFNESLCFMFFFFWSQHHLYTWLWESPVTSAIFWIFYLVQFISPSSSCLSIFIWTVLFLLRFLIPFYSYQKQSLSLSLNYELSSEFDFILYSSMY